MRTQKLFRIASFCSIALAMSLTSSQAQLATWIGPASGAEWNTAGNWDIGVPGTANPVVIGGGTNVNYNFPMVAANVGIVTNNGVLNINTNGFNSLGIALANSAGGDKVFINNGANVAVGGNFTMSTNAIVTMTAGSTLTINGALDVSFSTSTHSAGTAAFTNSGGAFSALSTAINNNQGTENALLVISGGTNNLGNTIIGRSAASSFPALGSEGLAIYGGVVTTTNLNVGNNGTGVSYLSCLIAGGTVTNQGNVFINQGTAARGSRLLETGGLFVVPDPFVVNPNGYAAAAAPASAVINVYSVTAGTNIVGGFYFGNSNLTALATINFTNSSVIYVGSQGIASNGAATVNASLGSGGLFGATAPWLGTVNMKLAGGMFTFQAADMNGTANNITLSNALTSAGGFNKTGGGTLTLDAANTYAGNTMIYNGTLAVGGTGSLLDSLQIFVASGAIFDVSQATSYTLSGSPLQTLMGFGTVNGMINVASGAVVFPGSNLLTGTLTLSGGLTETGGAINEFQLSGNPTGPNNDFLNASGGLNVSGINTIQINGGLQSGGVYPLISYGSGGFTGSVANFTVSGASGILSNSVTADTIYFIVQTSVRGSTNITWVGSVTNNNWDSEITSNWVDTGSANKDFFVPQDNVLFGNGAGTNVISLVGSLTPGSVTVKTTTNYFLTGLGGIGGNGGITVSNGTLTVLATNNFSGPVILDGGVLSTPVIANSSNPSGIGDSSSSPANFVFNGGTFNFNGGSASTDHGLTLTNGGGTIDVSNASTLTLNGSIVGNGPLLVTDTGTLILNSGNSYTNSTTIAGGIVQLSNAGGAGTGTINFSNATLAFSPSSGITVGNAFNFDSNTTNMLVITSGSSGNPITSGAWTGSGTVFVSNTFNPFTINGDLNGFSGTVILGTPNGSGFRFNSSGGNTSTGSTNATFDLSNTNALLLCRNPGVIDLGALQGSQGAQISGPGSTAGILTWSVGANNASTTYGGYIFNGTTPANEVGSLAKVGTGTLTLVGGTVTVVVGLANVTITTNLLQYSGPTTISNGVLALVVPDALFNSTNVTLATSTATLDASQMGYVDPISGNAVTNGVFELISGQVLSGLGTIRGTLVTDAGATFNLGLSGSIGVMTVTNGIGLNGTTRLKVNGAASDELISQTSITNGGNLVVTNIGGAFAGGTTFTLFHANSYIGTFSSITLPALLAGQSWNTSNLYINGTISVVGTGTPSGFSSVVISGSDIVLNATNGFPTGPVHVFATTNLLLPLAQWTSLAAGSFDNSGNFSYTNSGALTSGKPRQFFILHVP